MGARLLSCKAVLVAGRTRLLDPLPVGGGGTAAADAGAGCGAAAVRGGGGGGGGVVAVSGRGCGRGGVVRWPTGGEEAERGRGTRRGRAEER